MPPKFLSYSDAIRLLRKYAKQRERLLEPKCSNAGRQAEREARRKEIAKFLRKLERMEVS